MPDIFLSYSREDQVTARRFAEGLEHEGFSVWWDATLHSGEAYDQVTEKALREARAVVVLWSKTSVDSRWVRAEATTADRNKTLVPVMIEDCLRPVMFELTHTADLSKWKGDTNDATWQAYVADIRRFVHRDGSVPAAHARAPASAHVRTSGHGISAKVLGIIALAIVGTAGVLWLVLHPRGEPIPPAPPPLPAAARASVAVMPFANLTGDASKDYLGDGMAEELINVLAKVPGLTVPSRTSSFAYKGRNTDLKQIAKDLNVSTILEGSVRSAGETIRITAQLNDAQTDRHIWSQTYTRKFTDVFKLQDDLAHEIVTAFKTTMNADLPAFKSQAPPTEDLEAYSLYLQASYRGTGTGPQGWRNGIALLDQALARDPMFARAYMLRATFKWLQQQPHADVERDAQRAVDMDPGLGAQALLGAVEASRRHWVAAQTLFDAALAARPEDVDGTVPNVQVSAMIWPLGYIDRAVEVQTETFRRAPAEPNRSLILGRLYIAKGQDQQGVKYLELAIAQGADPMGSRIPNALADVAQRAGRYSEAADRIVSTLPPQALEVGGETTVRLVYAALEDPARRSAAIAALQGLLDKLAPASWGVKVWSMAWFTQLGALDNAYRAGEQLQVQLAVQPPAGQFSWVWAPEMRAFRRDPRFQPFMKRLGMMDYWQKYGPPDDCDLKDGKLICH